MVGVYGKYETQFRKRSTKSLITGYHRFNADFRKLARDEFKKRKVPVKSLPYKKPKKRRSQGFGFGSFKF